MEDAAPSHDPAIDKALKAAVAKLAGADNDYGRLLAVRNGIQELLALGHAAKPAIEQIRKSAIARGISDADVGKILEDAAETSNVRPLRSNGSAGSAKSPPIELETKNANTSSDSELDELNEKYAVVPIGGNVRVMDLSKETPTYYRVTDFRLLLGNRTKDEGKKHIPLATWWLSEPRRRQYEGVCFEPGKGQEVDRKRNLWTGFAVTPKPGNCARYLEFLREVICTGSQEHYDYLVNVMADAVQ